MNLPDDSADEDLLAQIGARRDRAAFAEFFRRYGRRVKALALKSGADAGEAEEIAQEVFLSVWRRADSYDPARAAASTWLFAIARNRRIDRLRRSRRPEPDPDDPLFRPGDEPAAESRFAAFSRDRAVRAAVGALSAEQRDVVRLGFFAGLSHSEIAAASDLPLGTVKSRMRLAFARLRAALGEGFRAELDDD